MNTTELIKKRYNRTALFYDCMDFFISDTIRQKVISLARGKVLEAGVGTGKNLKFYPSDCAITGIDFSPRMLEKASKRGAGMANVILKEMDIENLQFPESTFDTIISTCVFCSVPDPARGLAELRRVCKPGGQLVFLEHIRSSHKMMGLLMDFFNPLTVRLIGSNINRRTLETMETAGLQLSEVRTMGMEILKLVVAKPNK